MLRRFCLYGFLKNQRYFEPFLVLVFLEKGLTFLQIGTLIACREVTVNLLEIVSGGVADVHGRRRAMIGSFTAYIASFLLFATAESLGVLFVAMILYGVGDSFRSGTHKAMIFSWLRMQGRVDERTAVYGTTRSWSKIGSAVSVILGAGFVLLTNRYSTVFYFSVVPYALGIVNFLGYPAELDLPPSNRRERGRLGGHVWESLRRAFGQRVLRRLVLESMGFEGVFKSSKDYLQPVLAAAAIGAGSAWSMPGGLEDQQRVAVLVGAVYFGLHALSAVASRRAHGLAVWAGGEDRAARRIWVLYLATFGVLLPAMVYRVEVVMILGFAGVYLLQNVWRPILVSRFDAQGEERYGATVLSIESQAKSVATMVAAPVLGWGVDLVAEHGLGGEFWPVGVLGVAVSLVFVWMPARR